MSGESFLLLRRREVLAGLAAAGLVPQSALALAGSLSLRALFDRAAAAREPGRMLAILRAFEAGRLNRDDSVIYAMVVRGVERDQALRAAFPFGKADGSSPYVVSQRHGAYLDLQGKPATADIAAR